MGSTGGKLLRLRSCSLSQQHAPWWRKWNSAHLSPQWHITHGKLHTWTHTLICPLFYTQTHVSPAGLNAFLFSEMLALPKEKGKMLQLLCLVPIFHVCHDMLKLSHRNELVSRQWISIYYRSCCVTEPVQRRKHYSFTLSPKLLRELSIIPPEKSLVDNCFSSQLRCSSTASWCYLLCLFA